MKIEEKKKPTKTTHKIQIKKKLSLIENQLSDCIRDLKKNDTIRILPNSKN